MKALIIVFSPSGHTLKVAEHINSTLKEHKVTVQLINITKDTNYLTKEKISESLKKEVKAHDVLFIGGPLYAGHVEKHILQVIGGCKLLK